VNQKLGVGILVAALRQRLTREPGVHVTFAEPDIERATGHLAQIVAEEHVGQEQHRDVARERLNHGDGVPDVQQ